MLLATTTVADFDQFMKVFSTKGEDKRRAHGSKGALIFRDPTQADRVWVIFDWDEEGWQSFVWRCRSQASATARLHRGRGHAGSWPRPPPGPGPPSAVAWSATWASRGTASCRRWSPKADPPHLPGTGKGLRIAPQALSRVSKSCPAARGRPRRPLEAPPGLSSGRLRRSSLRPRSRLIALRNTVAHRASNLHSECRLSATRVRLARPPGRCPTLPTHETARSNDLTAPDGPRDRGADRIRPGDRGFAGLSRIVRTCPGLSRRVLSQRQPRGPRVQTCPG